MSRILVDQVRSNSASSDAITLDGSGNVTVPGNITLSGNATLSGTATGFPQTKGRNLIINGAMQVAQRGTSSTSSGYRTVDRFSTGFDSGLTEAPTLSQATLSSSDTPYTLGFRHAFRITNGNQTSQDANDYIHLSTSIESQDVAKSGWNYTSASSYITLSFWVKVSTAQTMYVKVGDSDANRTYTFSFSATTSWTKITKTIPGNSNLVFNNDNGVGIQLVWVPFYGSNYTTSSHTNDSWDVNSDGSDQLPDMANTWFSANDATFDITGVKLEVGSSATDFEHLSFTDDLRKCHRYFQELHIYTYVGTSTNVLFIESFNFHGGQMRATPSITGHRGASGENKFEGGGGDYGCTLYHANNEYIAIYGGAGSVNNYVRGSFDCDAEL